MMFLPQDSNYVSYLVCRSQQSEEILVKTYCNICDISLEQAGYLKGRRLVFAVQKKG